MSLFAYKAAQLDELAKAALKAANDLELYHRACQMASAETNAAMAHQQAEDQQVAEDRFEEARRKVG